MRPNAPQRSCPGTAPVVEEEPDAPSAAAAKAPMEVALARRLTPQPGWRAGCRGPEPGRPQALAKDPARRYVSAEALADDIRRHLDSHPVQARRDTMGYRTMKFVRRHQVGVSAATVAVLSQLLGAFGMAWQADRARREARRALAVQRFLVGVFEGADPTRSLGETITARQLLDEGALWLRGEPATDPSTRAELADTLARTYRSLGRLDEAFAWSRDAAQRFRDSLGPLHPRTALAELTEAEVRADRARSPPRVPPWMASFPVSRRPMARGAPSSCARVRPGRPSFSTPARGRLPSTSSRRS
jgi:serine/threonine-protein kinase